MTEATIAANAASIGRGMPSPTWAKTNADNCPAIATQRMKINVRARTGPPTPAPANIGRVSDI
ncbi:MAG: hypothetical protein EXQ89_04270 [Rhodospirillaceae bacterium]|nr:hypothetical protein [Rhodospirillaceae bacterium]